MVVDKLLGMTGLDSLKDLYKAGTGVLDKLNKRQLYRLIISQIIIRWIILIILYMADQATSMEETLSNSDNISIDESDGNKLLRKELMEMKQNTSDVNAITDLTLLVKSVGIQLYDIQDAVVACYNFIIDFLDSFDEAMSTKLSNLKAVLNNVEEDI